jgi:hypothetical protein
MALRTALAVLATATLAWAAFPTPTQWPNRFTMTQIGYFTYVPGTITVDDFIYDFPNDRMKVYSRFTVTPPSIIGDAMRDGLIVSIWHNGTLRIWQQFPALGNTTNCVSLDMGFGIPVPNWFLTNSTNFAVTWSGHKWVNDNQYHLVQWTRKLSGPAGDGNGTHFNYFSDNRGVPFKLIAPTPGGEVVNEWYNQTAVESFPDGEFENPFPSVQCQVTSADAAMLSPIAAEIAGMMRRWGESSGVSKH